MDHETVTAIYSVNGHSEDEDAVSEKEPQPPKAMPKKKTGATFSPVKIVSRTLQGAKAKAMTKKSTRKCFLCCCCGCSVGKCLVGRVCLCLFLLIGAILVCVGCGIRVYYTDYFDCACKGVSVKGVESPCNAGITIDTLASLLGLGSGARSPGDPSIVAPTERPTPANDGSCVAPILVCKLDCGTLYPQYPISTLDHHCNHNPVPSGGDIFGACSDEWNNPVHYYFNPCAWDDGKANATSHGPKGYHYNGRYYFCSDAVDTRPKIALVPSESLVRGTIVSGSIMIAYTLFVMVIKVLIWAVERAQKNHRGRYDSDDHSETVIMMVGSDSEYSDGEDAPQTQKKRSIKAGVMALIGRRQKADTSEGGYVQVDEDTENLHEDDVRTFYEEGTDPKEENAI